MCQSQQISVNRLTDCWTKITNRKGSISSEVVKQMRCDLEISGTSFRRQPEDPDPTRYPRVNTLNMDNPTVLARNTTPTQRVTACHAGRSSFQAQQPFLWSSERGQESCGLSGRCRAAHTHTLCKFEHRTHFVFSRTQRITFRFLFLLPLSQYSVCGRIDPQSKQAYLWCAEQYLTVVSHPSKKSSDRSGEGAGMFGTGMRVNLLQQVTGDLNFGPHAFAVLARAFGLMEVSKASTKGLQKSLGRTLLGKDVAFSGCLGCRGNAHDGDGGLLGTALLWRRRSTRSTMSRIFRSKSWSKVGQAGWSIFFWRIGSLHG